MRSEGLRFLLAGAANTAITFIAYWLLLRVIDYRLAYSIAYVTGVVLSYLLNNFYVFRTRPKLASALAFPLVYVVQYSVGVAVLWFWVSLLRLPAAYGVIATVIASLPVTFVLSRLVLRKL